MASMGRVIGHAMGGLFLVLGIGFLVLGFSDAFTSWLDTNSACQYGECSGATAGARTTFLLLGGIFTFTGIFISVVTEFSIRKTRQFVGRIGSLTSNPGAGLQNLDDLLQPFGINIDPASNPNVTVNRQVIDLRSQRTGDVPTDPSGLNNYLKGFGINLGEDALRNATVVEGGEVVQRGAGSTAPPVNVPAAQASSSADSELRRETATIVRKKDRGSTAGNQRLIEFDLEVRPAGRVPYRVEVATLVRESLAGLLIEGSTLNVRVDPRDENSVTIDWSEN